MESGIAAVRVWQPVPPDKISKRAKLNAFGGQRFADSGIAERFQFVRTFGSIHGINVIPEARMASQLSDSSRERRQCLHQSLGIQTFGMREAGRGLSVKISGISNDTEMAERNVESLAHLQQFGTCRLVAMHMLM